MILAIVGEWKVSAENLSDEQWQRTFCGDGQWTVTSYFLRNCQKWSPQGHPWPRGHILKSLASNPRKLPCPRLEDSTIF